MLESLKNIDWNTELAKFKAWESTKNWQFCSVVGKNPSVSGKDWYSAEFKETNNATGFGVKLGVASNGLMCADIDGQPAIDLFKSYGLELTIASSSRDGSEAYYFQVPEQYWDLIARDEIKTGQTYTKPDGTVAQSKIELRWGVMQQVMPPSIHPLTDEPYRWINSPEDAPLAIAPDQFIELMMLKKQGGAKPVTPQQALPYVTSHYATKDDVTRAREYMQYLPNYKADDRANWISVGWWLKSIDECLYTDWLQWSASFSNFGSEKECEQQWRSFKSLDTIDKAMGSLCNLAKRGGWVGIASLTPKERNEKIIATGKRFKINLSNLCSLPSRRVFQGTSTLVTANSLMSVYLELKDWEQALASLFPDTKIVSSPRQTINRVARRWQIDDHEIDAAIAGLGDLTKCLVIPSDDRIDMVRLWRTNIVEGKGDNEEEIKKDIERKEKQEHHNMRERVIAWFRTNLLFNQQIDMWHRYVGGVWNVATDKEIKAEARQLLTDLDMTDTWLKHPSISDDKVTNFVKEIQSAVLIERLDAVKEYKHLINMQDGVLNRRTKQLLPHDRKYMFSWQLPYKWEDRHLGAKIIQDWMSWTFEHEDQIKLLLCWLNATICERVDIQKVLQLVGSGGAGKSTFSKLAMALTGVSNVHQSSIELMDTQFEPSNFIGKKLIAISEIGEYRGSGTTLKKVTGRDRIPNQIKFHQARNSGFTYKGQMIIIANKEFAPHDSGSSFERRNICVPFSKVIANSKKRNLIEIDDDGSVSGEFAACLPAFLEMVLDLTDKEVSQYLNETNVYVPTLNDAATNSILNGDTLAQWVEDNLVAIEGVKSYIGKAELIRVTELVNGKSVTKNVYAKADTRLFANYVKYCAENGAKDKDSVNMQNFSRRVLDLFSGTLRNTFVKKATKDRDGCAILGLTIRTPEHAHIPTPIKGLLLCEEAVTEYVNIQTLTDANFAENAQYSQPLPASSPNPTLTTTTPLLIENSSNNSQNLHLKGFEYTQNSSQVVTEVVTQENLTKGDKVEICIPDDVISHPDIVTALENGSIPFLDLTYVVHDVYVIDGNTYIGVIDWQQQERKVWIGYVNKITEA